MEVSVQVETYDLPELRHHFLKEWRQKSDHDIAEISKVLQLNSFPKWGESPRLYCVLRMLRRLDIMDKLLADGICDIFLPVFPPLGNSFKGLGNNATRFLRAQEYVLSNSPRHMTQTLSCGHFHTASPSDIGLLDRKQIISDAFGSIGTVFDSISKRLLTRRTLQRRPQSEEPRHTAAGVRYEVANLKKVSHHHCAQFVGSYTTPQCFAFLSSPPAEVTLWEYMKAPVGDEGAGRALYQNWFGCLASALLYLQSRSIRNYAVKAENIIVHGADVFLSNIDLTFSGEHTERAMIPNGANQDHQPTTSECRLLFHEKGAGKSAMSNATGYLDDWDGNKKDQHCTFFLGFLYLQIIAVLSDSSPMSLQEYTSEQVLRLEATKFLEISPDATAGNQVIKPIIASLTKHMLLPGAYGPPTLQDVGFEVTQVGWCGPCCTEELSRNPQHTFDQLCRLVVSKDHFSKDDIEKTKQELARSRRTDLATVPRIYIILCRLHRLDLVPKFIRERITDIWIPFDKHVLRKFLKDEHDRREFSKHQDVVLSKHFIPNEHHHFNDGDDHFNEVKRLGAGGFGSVWHCVDPKSGIQVAKKVMSRNRKGFYSWVEDTNTYTRELRVLRKISKKQHKHLISMIGSYTDAMDFAILFSPVADMNLATYLDDPADINNIEKWFGCLATSLQFLHGMKIRHKDVKPQNCLVHGDNIILTDFGISYDWSESSGPATSGGGVRDPRYCAPEVFEWEQRNESADIWSLGCVFLEMYSVRHGFRRESIKEHFESHGNGSAWYQKNEEALSSWLTHLRRRTLNGSWLGYSFGQTGTYPLSLIQRMVLFDKTKRLTSKKLVEKMFDPTKVSEELRTRFCGRCCIQDYDQRQCLLEDGEEWTFIIPSPSEG